MFQTNRLKASITQSRRETLENRNNSRNSFHRQRTSQPPVELFRQLVFNSSSFSRKRNCCCVFRGSFAFHAMSVRVCERKRGMGRGGWRDKAIQSDKRHRNPSARSTSSPLAGSTMVSAGKVKVKGAPSMVL